MDTRRLRLEPSLLMLPQSVTCTIYFNELSFSVDRIRGFNLAGLENLLAGWPYRSRGYYLHHPEVEVLNPAILHN